MNVNGRYICSDCGKEIPEAEVNIGSWGEGSFEGEKVVSVPGSVNVASTEESVSGDDDFLQNESVSVEASKETSSLAEIEPEIVDEESDQGFYTPENTQILSQMSPDAQKIETGVIARENNATGDLPQARIKVSVASQSQPLPSDPNIYRDPIMEDMSQVKEEERQTASANNDVIEKRPSSKDKKIITAVILTGAILALLLLGGGLFAFFTLTKEVNNVGTRTVEDNVSSENINAEGAIIDNGTDNNIKSSQTETSNSVDSAQ